MVDGHITEARVCVSGVDQVPHRCREAEELLDGSRPGSPAVGEAADAVRDTVHPTDDLHATGAYRRDVAGTLLARSVSEAARQAVRPTTSAA